MNVLDLYWYLFYRFSFYTCKREKSNAKWVATLATSVPISCTIDSFIRVYLFQFDYPLFIKYWYSGTITITVILMSLISIAYFYGVKKVSINKQEKAYSTYSRYKRKWIWLFFICFTIGSLLFNIALKFLISPVKTI